MRERVRMSSCLRASMLAVAGVGLLVILIFSHELTYVGTQPHFLVVLALYSAEALSGNQFHFYYLIVTLQYMEYQAFLPDHELNRGLLPVFSIVVPATTRFALLRFGS